MSEVLSPRPINRAARIGIVLTVVGVVAFTAALVLFFLEASVYGNDPLTPYDYDTAAILTPILLILGVVFSVRGVIRSSKFGERGVAIAGIAVSSIFLIILIFIAIVIAFVASVSGTPLF
jgi:hypothetical protein